MSGLPLPTMASAAQGAPAQPSASGSLPQMPTASAVAAQPAPTASAGGAAGAASAPAAEQGGASAAAEEPGSGTVVPATSAVDLSIHRSGIVPTIQNVVATMNLGCQLNLQQIAIQVRNAEFKPSRFAAVIWRLRDPRTTTLIFASGKLVCTGAKSEKDAERATKKCRKIIEKLGFKGVKAKDFKIQNMVGSCDVKFPIRLEGLHYNQQPFSKYEPEMFAGLMYRMIDPKVVLLIFVSGKVIITGAKTRSQIYEAFEAIYPVLQEYRKT
eukprot:m.21569 g.21569  ORF g.21569 m.21569 type:complete len:269 (+) comp3906_c0_seq1:207-1013(+)